MKNQSLIEPSAPFATLPKGKSCSNYDYEPYCHCRHGWGHPTYQCYNL